MEIGLLRCLYVYSCFYKRVPTSHHDMTNNLVFFFFSDFIRFQMVIL